MKPHSLGRRLYRFTVVLSIFTCLSLSILYSLSLSGYLSVCIYMNIFIMYRTVVMLNFSFLILCRLTHSLSLSLSPSFLHLSLSLFNLFPSLFSSSFSPSSSPSFHPLSLPFFFLFLSIFLSFSVVSVPHLCLDVFLSLPFFAWPGRLSVYLSVSKWMYFHPGSGATGLMSKGPDPA